MPFKQLINEFNSAVSKLRNRASIKTSKSTNYLFERLNFHLIHGYPIDLNNPQSFSEKIIWKKLYDRNPILPVVADKHAVRTYVLDTLGSKGEKILIPQYWVGENPEDIPFDTLPPEYVVKANHGSGMNLIQRRSSPENNSDIIKIAKKWLQKDFGLRRNEWCYSQIPRKIVIDKLLCDEEGRSPQDIKLYMFGGELGLILIHKMNGHQRRSAFFDPNLNRINVRKSSRLDSSINLPENINDAIEIAKALSQDFDHIRVDLYSHEGQIYFGEMTNYSASGRVAFHPRSFDFELGKLWVLDKTHAINQYGKRLK